MARRAELRALGSSLHAGVLFPPSGKLRLRSGADGDEDADKKSRFSHPLLSSIRTGARTRKLVKYVFVFSFVAFMLYAFDLLNLDTLRSIMPFGGSYELPSIASGLSMLPAALRQQPAAPRRPFVYIIPLPAKYNLDLLTACSHLHDYGAAKLDFCAAVQNDGFGPQFRPFGSQDPKGVWFKTDSNMLEARPPATRQHIISSRPRCASVARLQRCRSLTLPPSSSGPQYIIHQRLLASGHVTDDILKADLYYVPYYAGLDFMLRLSKGQDVEAARARPSHTRSLSAPIPAPRARRHDSIRTQAPPRPRFRPRPPQGCAEVEAIVKDHAMWAGAQGRDFVMTAGRGLPYMDGRRPHGFGTGCLGRPALSEMWKLSCAPGSPAAFRSVAPPCTARKLSDLLQSVAVSGEAGRRTVLLFTPLRPHLAGSKWTETRPGWESPTQRGALLHQPSLRCPPPSAHGLTARARRRAARCAQPGTPPPPSRSFHAHSDADLEKRAAALTRRAWERRRHPVCFYGRPRPGTVRDQILRQCKEAPGGGCFYDEGCAREGTAWGAGAPCDQNDVLALCVAGSPPPRLRLPHTPRRLPPPFRARACCSSAPCPPGRLLPPLSAATPSAISASSPRATRAPAGASSTPSSPAASPSSSTRACARRAAAPEPLHPA